ncbi:MAG: hypothetical protein EAZ32_10500 [Cytophagia bacterium]|nr:MAG: hypothetical protein EAZ46_05930 [Runella sp.]TAG24969.1 MAG: hypothetical protein EAZ38_00490 [Cytophagales bacterium]TAG39193.1 MAG: hypothetical protein EAZ32_10500 [Cytophagia bacterium]TAG48200.1 MAG: hypothetical protein EAZ29_13670 [Runella slithyformis]TAG84455.1 MAG: hypothetical protein EAZ22_00650 [Cytophagales bacterium]
MARIKVIMENENGDAIASKYYNLGTDFSNIDKIEEAVHSISGGLLTDVSAHLLNSEQDSFLKKVSTRLMVNIP